MQTLYTGLNSITNAVYSYSNVSNLNRVCRFNQEQLRQRVLNTSYRLNHAHPLVALLEFMQIDPNWTEEELRTVIDFKTERWASNANVVGVYNSGRLQRGVLYQEDFSELLISLPPQYKFTDYLTMDEKVMCPFIPVYSESTQLDFRPVKDKPLSAKPTKLAVIGIDFMCLAVAYWRYMKGSQIYGFDTSPEKWLTYPLMNAQILGNRLVVLNALYKGVTQGVKPEELVTVPRTTFAINPVETLLKRHIKDLHKLLSRNPMHNIEHFLGCLQTLDDLPTPEDNPIQWMNPGRYAMYLKCRWVWNMPYMRLLTTYLHYGKLSRARNGATKSNVDRWLLQDVKLSTGNIRNPSLTERYVQLRNKLDKSANL